MNDDSMNILTVCANGMDISMKRGLNKSTPFFMMTEITALQDMLNDHPRNIGYYYLRKTLGRSFDHKKSNALWKEYPTKYNEHVCEYYRWLYQETHKSQDED